MSNDLQNFNNLLVNLAQSAYPDGPKPFEKFKNPDKSVEFDFSKDYKGIPGGQAPDVKDKLYLQ